MIGSEFLRGLDSYEEIKEVFEHLKDTLDEATAALLNWFLCRGEKVDVEAYITEELDSKPDLIGENMEIWDDEFKSELVETMKEAVALEKEFIEDCLPVSSVGLSVEDFCTYIDFIADRRLEGVGLSPINPGVQNPFPWLSETMDLKKEANFFEQKVTDYQQSSALLMSHDDDL